VLVGDLPLEGPAFKSGDLVTIVRDRMTVLTSLATLELHRVRGKAGLSLSEVDADVRIGDVVEA
jgi:hypothetical protein